MIKKIIYFILLFFLIYDVGFSFIQHKSQILDGDVASHIIPAEGVKPVFENPFGIKAIITNQKYANPNRFFSHFMFKEYFTTVPLILQNIAQPIDSVYLSCAVSKILIQVLFILLLTQMISNTWNLLKPDFIIAATLVTPLFQTNGYCRYMGIIDPSITYTFFYALPLALLLIYLLPFIQRLNFNNNLFTKPFYLIFWIPLALIVCLSGPTNPGIILVFSMLVFFKKLKFNYSNSNGGKYLNKWIAAIRMIPKHYWMFLLPVSIFSLYSLFLGRYNSFSVTSRISLGELYTRLPAGIYYQFTQKLGFPILFTILFVNTFLIYKKYKTPEGKKILKTFKWVGIFAFCYFILLPLGGYREYRHNILRYDTIMPVTLSLIYVFGISTLFLINNLHRNQKLWYIPLIIGVLFIYMNADEAKFDKNKCEKEALLKIAQSKESIVQLNENCTVLDWQKTVRAEDSELNAQLLVKWRITAEKKLYYNK